VSLPFGGYYRGRRVLVTGHTGFKGGWLARWLLELGAEVTGAALDPPTEPSLFRLLSLQRRLRDERQDVRDLPGLNRLAREARPELVFHLAAQSLVRRGFQEPLATLQTNVLGTANVIEAAAGAGAGAAVVVTSDKCYRNDESERPFREGDPLGGCDPYSCSKAAAEMVVEAYRAVFGRGGPLLASVRAGNVIGGGDWAEERLVPDLVRALAQGRPVALRSPGAVRPWQHVLEPLAGYLDLGRRLAQGQDSLAAAFNFGPEPASFLTVRELVEICLSHWPGGRWEDASDHQAGQPVEARTLCLDSARAARDLAWRPLLSIGQAAAWTMEWHQAHQAGGNLEAITAGQLEGYVELAASKGVGWVRD